MQGAAAMGGRLEGDNPTASQPAALIHPARLRKKHRQHSCLLDSMHSATQHARLHELPTASSRRGVP